jgi:hypothetical protein
MSYTIEDNDEWFRDIYKRVSMLTIEEITANDREIFYKLCKEFYRKNYWNERTDVYRRRDQFE